MLNRSCFFAIGTENASRSFKICTDFFIVQSKPWVDGSSAEARKYEKMVLEKAEQAFRIDLEKGTRLSIAAEGSLIDLGIAIKDRSNETFSRNWKLVKKQALRLIPFWDRRKKWDRRKSPAE